MSLELEYEKKLSKILDSNEWTIDAHQEYCALFERISNGYLKLSELEEKVWNHLQDMREEKTRYVREMNTRIVQIICDSHGHMWALDDHSQMWRRDEDNRWFFRGDVRCSWNIDSGEFSRIRRML